MPTSNLSLNLPRPPPPTPHDPYAVNGNPSCSPPCTIKRHSHSKPSSLHPSTLSPETAQSSHHQCLHRHRDETLGSESQTYHHLLRRKPQTHPHSPPTSLLPLSAANSPTQTPAAPIACPTRPRTQAKAPTTTQQVSRTALPSRQRQCRPLTCRAAPRRLMAQIQSHLQKTVCHSPSSRSRRRRSIMGSRRLLQQQNPKPQPRSRAGGVRRH